MFYLRLVVKKLLKLSFKPPLLIFGMFFWHVFQINQPSTCIYADNKERAAFFLLVWPTCTHFNLEVFENIFPNVWNIGYWLIPTGYENFRTIAICTVCM